MALPLATGTPFDGFLLAFQAAGLIINMKTAKDSQNQIRQGRAIEQAQFESNLEAIRLESAQASLDSMKELRQNLGNQMAIQAARGTSSAAGTALAASQESVASFGSDERTRKMNLLAKEANLRGANTVSALKSLQSETQLGQALLGKVVNTFGTTSNVDAFRRSKLGKQWGFGLSEA